MFLSIYSFILTAIAAFLILWTYLKKPNICRSNVCLVGKTALVTGANRGIGLEVALGLAQRGCRVILACRRGLEETKQRIIEETKNTNIVAYHLDLLSFESVRNFVKQVKKSEQKLDILIHNAALINVDLTHTGDGLNPIMQVNHFSPFLLTHLLVDLLKKSAPSRVVFVSSYFAYFSNLTPEKLNYPEVPGSFILLDIIYNDSKLCNIISAAGFGKRLEKHGITVNAVHPGLVQTGIFDFLEVSFLSYIFYIFFNIFIFPLLRAPQEGAYAIIDAATSINCEKTVGKFLSGDEVIDYPTQLSDEAFCKRVWEASEEFVKLPKELKLSEDTEK